MKLRWRRDWLSIAALVYIAALAAWSWRTITGPIPVYWNINGQVDRYGSRFEGILALPLAAVSVLLLFQILPLLDPGRANYRQFAGAYATLRTGVLVLLATLYTIEIAAAHEAVVDVGRLSAALFGLLFIVIGVILPKVRPNWFVGIRTPWTLSSKRSWQQTHRLGGRLFAGLGALLLLLALLSASGAVTFAVLLGGSAILVTVLLIYSFVEWRGDPDKSPPAGTLPA
ncbi:MAG: SdpI family protein [Chloroflexi bacterium]|nr:SdpI family protein [Chloroflexota bacterium]